MAFTVQITDQHRRGATAKALAPRATGKTVLRCADGRVPRSARLIKNTVDGSFELLAQRHDGDLDALAEALIAGDPEVPLEQLGGRLREASRVYLRQDGSPLHAARVLRVVSDPRGEEVSREDFLDLEATVGDHNQPLPWTGRLLPAAEVVHHHALVRKLQLRHVDGETYAVLHDIARQLQEAGALLLMGSGEDGSQPLILTRNGSPYRGFLEGRIDGAAYRLVLHLSDLELQAPEPGEEGG